MLHPEQSLTQTEYRKDVRETLYDIVGHDKKTCLQYKQIIYRMSFL